ncbi:MAG: type II restriction enzyme [Chloroflexota bacterium]
MARANDVAWETFIREAKIGLDGRSYVVDAKNLKRIAQREPRLMAKVDEPEQLPTVLQNAGYSLLAITNGSYLIFQGNVFVPVPDCSVQSIYNPRTEFPLETIGRGTGESEYLDNAFNTGLLSDFTGSGVLYLTIRGRERTKKFSFLIGESNIEINVNGVQIEVDAGYEGENDIVLVEGKIGNRSHFNVRQLYYPFRHFSQLVPQKNVRTLFFSYDLSRATYSLHEFGFGNPEVFDSIYPIKCCVYSLSRSQAFAVEELFDRNFETVNNIVPQADDLNKILELLTLINSGQNTVTEIADHFVFDERQSNYYGEAAEFLGLITRNRGVFELTERGFQFVSTEPSRQQLFIAKLVINTWFFKELLRRARRKGFFTESDIRALIETVEKESGDKRYTQSTVGRRIRTIVSWVRWISEEFKSIVIDQDRFILK